MKTAGVLNLICGSVVALVGGFFVMWGTAQVLVLAHQVTNATLGLFVLIVFGGGYLLRRGLLHVRSSRAQMLDVAEPVKAHSVEDRLDELERLKRRAMVTPEEYEAKRKDILNDL